MTSDDDSIGNDANPDRVGIRMDVLKSIMEDLDGNPRLQQIFGTPVLAGLVIVADANDLRIEDRGAKELTEEESQIFLESLDATISKYS